MSLYLYDVLQLPCLPITSLDLLLEQTCQSVWTMSGHGKHSLAMTLEAVVLERRRECLIAAAARWLLRDSLGRLSPTGRVGVHLWISRERGTEATVAIADTAGMLTGNLVTTDLERAINCIRWAGCQMARKQTALGITTWIQISAEREGKLFEQLEGESESLAVQA